MDDLTDTPSNKNKEAYAQGIANFVSGLFGGMAGCATIGQSVINIKSGGRTRLSTLSAGIFLLLFMLIYAVFRNSGRKNTDGSFSRHYDRGIDRYFQSKNKSSKSQNYLGRSPAVFKRSPNITNRVDTRIIKYNRCSSSNGYYSYG